MFFHVLQLSQLHFDQGTGVPSGKMSDTLTLFQLQKMLLEEYGKEEHYLCSCATSLSHTYRLLYKHTSTHIHTLTYTHTPYPYTHSSLVNYGTQYALLEQSLMYEFSGEAHFNATQNPHLYFQVLLLSQQFESVSACMHTVVPYSYISMADSEI